MRRVLITHTDLDGLASGALLLRRFGSLDKVFFAQPHHLHSRLAGVPNGSVVYVTDLGVNRTTLSKVKEQVRRILESGGEVYWFDHHVWDYPWIEDFIKLGVNLHVNRDVCTAWIVYKYLGGDGPDDLARVACSVDLWMMDDWRGNYLSRYVGYAGGSTWKERVLKRLARFNGVIDTEIAEVVEKAITEELSVYSKAIKKARLRECNRIKVVYYLKDSEEHLTSYVANALIARYEADIAVICRRGSVSLRSRDMDVREVAVAMGGGGHSRAAGAGLRPSLIRKIIYVIGLRRLYADWCVDRVMEHICRSRNTRNTST
ncbi:MAG: DHHA1 domain-containing protein [Zestosphaera sp.]